MEQPTSFLPLLTVVFLAFIVPFILSRFRRVRPPIVVGEIIAGILVGRSGLGWVAGHDPVLDLLAEFGFVFLMFLAGMEIDFSNLGALNNSKRSNHPGWGHRLRGPVPLAGLSFGITLALSLIVGLGLTRLGLVQDPWMMALILSTTSLGVVVPVLKEQGLSSGRFGQTLLVAALIADFVTMLLITVVVAALSRGLTLDILLISLLFVAFLLMYRFGMFFFNQLTVVRRVMEELGHTPAQIKVRAAFTMMLLFVGLAEVLGTEIILGAFLAGAIVSLLSTPEDADLIHQLEAVGFGFFIPIFFIMVGVDFNLPALLASPQALLLLPLLLLAAIVVKLVSALLLRLNFTWREALAGGILLSARLSLIIAASAIGMRVGVISESVNTAIILVAIVTVITAPLLFNQLMPRRRPQEERPIIVVGATSLGLQVADQLQAHQEPVVVMDSDEGRLERARRRGLKTVLTHPDRDDPRAAPYYEAARTLVCTYADTRLNYRICRLARTTYGLNHVVAYVTDPNAISRFEQLGVTPMNEAVDRAALLVLLARNPDVYTLLTRTDDDKEVSEVVVRNRRCAGKLLSQIELPGDLLVVALRRNGELVIPHGDTRLEYGDRLTLVGSVECIESVRRFLAGLEDRA